MRRIESVGTSRNRRKKTSRILIINFFTILIYLTIQGIVILLMKLLPDILASNDVLRESNLFYDAYNIGVCVLVALLYLFWGYLMGKAVYNFGSFKRVLSFSIVTIGNILFILYLYILSLGVSEGSGDFGWSAYYMLNIGFMPIMDIFTGFESIHYLLYIGYIIVAFLPVFMMVFGAELRIKRLEKSKRLF